MTSVTYDPDSRFEVHTVDVEYLKVDGQVFLAKIYRPEGSGPFPLMLDVHGGVWAGGDRANNQPLDEALASSGLVVAAIDFRCSPIAPYPASVADVNYATRWLRSRATEFDADPSSLGLMGTSSGGHLVLLSAMRPRDPRYTVHPTEDAATEANARYVIGCWPIVDPWARYLYAIETGRKQLVARSEEYFLTTDAMREGNPQLILENGIEADRPPVLLLQGTADDNIPYAIVQRFADTYREAGGECQIELFEGAPHKFAGDPGPATDLALSYLKAFIAKQVGTSTDVAANLPG